MSKQYTESIPESLGLEIDIYSSHVRGVYFYSATSQHCTTLDDGYWILDRGPNGPHAAGAARFYTMIHRQEYRSNCLEEIEQHLAEYMVEGRESTDGMFYSRAVHQANIARAWIRTDTDYWCKAPATPCPVRGFDGNFDAEEFGEVEWMELIEFAFGCECPSYDSNEWSEEQFNPFGPGAKMGADDVVEAQFGLASARFWSAIGAASRVGAL